MKFILLPKVNKMTEDQLVKRPWMFTVNNYDEEDCLKFSEIWLNQKPKMNCLVYGKEVGEIEKTPHLQCFIYFKNNTKGFDKIRSWWPKAAKIQWSQVPYAGYAYCLKGEQPKAEWERDHTKGPNYGKNYNGEFFGVPPKPQGERNDLTKTIELVTSGKVNNLRDFLLHEESCKSVQNINCFNKILREFPEFRMYRDLEELPKIVYCYGSSGAGKSEYCKRVFKEKFGNKWRPHVYEFVEEKWWDNYHWTQKYLFMDEFRGYMMKFATLIKLCDKGPFEREAKGILGGVDVMVDTIYITSPLDPIELYENHMNDKDNIYQFVRRINQILEFSGSWKDGTSTFKEVTWDDLKLKYCIRENNKELF